MSKPQMIIEHIVERAKILESDKKNLPEGVLCRVAYPICNIGVLNHNGRIYEEKLWDLVENNKDIKTKLEKRCLFGHAEHPPTTQSNLEKTAHIITKLYREPGLFEGKECVKEKAVFDVLDTPYGRIVDTIMKADCAVGCSTRAEGELEECVDESTGQRYNRVIPESYRFVTVDFTADPSTFDSYPENVERDIVGHIQNGMENKKIDRDFAVQLLEEMKCSEAKTLMEKIGKKNEKAQPGDNVKNIVKGKKKSNIDDEIQKFYDEQKQKGDKNDKIMKDIVKNFKLTADQMLMTMKDLNIQVVEEKKVNEEVPAYNGIMEEPMVKKDIEDIKKKLDDAGIDYQDEEKAVEMLKTGFLPGYAVMMYKDYILNKEGTEANESIGALKSLAKKSGKSVEKAEEYWKKAKKQRMESEDKTEDQLEKSDFKYIMGVVKKRLGLSEKVNEDAMIKASKYHWGEYGEDEDIGQEEIDSMVELTADQLEGFTVRDEDKNKKFFAYDYDVEETEDEGTGVKNAYAISLLPERKIEEMSAVEIAKLSDSDLQTTYKEKVKDALYDFPEINTLELLSGEMKKRGIKLSESMFDDIEFFQKEFEKLADEQKNVVSNLLIESKSTDDLFKKIKDFDILMAEKKAELDVALMHIDNMTESFNRTLKNYASDLVILSSSGEDKEIKIKESNKKIGEAKEEITKIIEERSKIKSELTKTAEQIDQLKEQIKKLEEQKKESDAGIEKLKECAIKLKKDHKREIIETYVKAVLKTSGLKLQENCLALLNRCSTESEVDRRIEEFRHVISENVLHSKALDEIQITEVKSDPEFESIDSTIGSAMRSM